MITVNVHYPGREPVIRKFSALPQVGSFLEMDGGLWVVDAVVFREASTTWTEARATVYAVQVKASQTSELREVWKTWANTPGKDLP